MDILTNITSIWENTDLVWKNFDIRKTEYKQTILNESLTLEFLKIYNISRVAINHFNTYRNTHYGKNDTGLIYNMFFHHLLSVHKNNKEIILEIAKIIKTEFLYKKANGHSQYFNLLDYANDELKNDVELINSIIDITLNQNSNLSNIDKFTYYNWEIHSLLRKLNFSNDFNFLYQLNYKIISFMGNEKKEHHLYFTPTNLFLTDDFKIYVEKRNCYIELQNEIIINPIQKKYNKIKI